MLSTWRKSQARKAALKKRSSLDIDPVEAGRALVANFPDEIWPVLNSSVGGYRALSAEIDPEPLLDTFYCEQVRLALPCVMGPGQPLVFRSWSPGDELVEGVYKIQEPSPTLPRSAPDLILVPLLAFDDAGRRLGYGGGYYDRTLSVLKQTAQTCLVGLAYEAQKLTQVPTEPHDVALDWIVTEHSAYRC